MFMYGLVDYSNHFNWFLAQYVILNTMYGNKKFFFLKKTWGQRGAGLYAYLSSFQFKEFAW